MVQTIFEKLGIEYEERNGFSYPLLEVSADTMTAADEDAAADYDRKSSPTDAGRYGRMWLGYMKENEPHRYRLLYRLGRLYAVAAEVNNEAYQMMDTVTEKYLKRNLPKVANSFMETWKLREQAKAGAEETVLADVVYRYR